MKAAIVGTWFGQALLSLSRWRALRFIPSGNPEAACSVANRILADKLISRLCPPGGTFVDIGAHIGSIFSAVHHFDKSVKIIAFEADPSKARYLKRKYRFCRVYGVAVGEQSGTVDFYTNSKASGFNSLVKGNKNGHETITVPIARIDDILSDTPVDVIKIDIEGAELGALRGAQDTIRRNRPIIMFESARFAPNAMGYSAELLWEWFDKRDYEIVTPDRVPHNVSSMSLEAFRDAHQYPVRTINYFAIPIEKRKTIRDKAREIIGIVANTRTGKS